MVVFISVVFDEQVMPENGASFSIRAASLKRAYVHFFELLAGKREVGFDGLGQFFPFGVITKMDSSSVEEVQRASYRFLHSLILVRVCLVEQIGQVIYHVRVDLRFLM